MATKIDKPRIGEVYEDHKGRLFRVVEVHIGDSLGREVIGTIVYPNAPDRFPYACNLNDWMRTWRDKAEPSPVSTMKIG